MAVEFFTLEALKNPASLLVAVVLIVQFLKEPLDHVIQSVFKVSLPTKILVLVISWSLMFSVDSLQNNITMEGSFLNIVNGIVIAAAAMKTAEAGKARRLMK